MLTYVYKVTNRLNGKVYYGKTVDVRQRWTDHVRDALHGSSTPFHRALRKYGSKAFLAEVLSEHLEDADAGAEETRLIAQTPRKCRYNVAPGGDGGMTLTQAQVDRQYAIGPSLYPVFQVLFDEGLSAQGLAERLGTSRKAVFRCARRLGLFFRQRKPIKPRQPRRRRTTPSKARYSSEERARLRSEVARKSNMARGLPRDLQNEVLRMYFQEHATAKEVAHTLGISTGSVRSTVNKEYAHMDTTSRAAMKHTHGSMVRTGARNPNSRA